MSKSNSDSTAHTVATATVCPIPPADWLEHCAAADAASPAARGARGRLRVVAREERTLVDARTVIRLEPGQLHEYAARAERVMADVLYTQGRTRMVRIAAALELDDSDRTKANVERDPDQPVILPASAAWLRRRLSERVSCEKFDARREDWRAVDVPRDLADHIAGQGDWPGWHELVGIANAPFLRSDLTICATSGYDPSSKVYLHPRREFPAIPDRPTKSAALRALERLLEPFSEFPFASPAARAAFAVHVLTACARHALDVRPLWLYTAPAAGTGKTLLARCASLIAEGTPPAVRQWPENEAELKKSILAAVLASDPTVLLDNVPSGTKVRSAALCALSTSDTYSDRVLGLTQLATAVNRSMVVLTGNNLTAAGDLARRALIVRQDAGMEKVRGRLFRINDLKQHVLEHREELLAAALTILRAYAGASDPVNCPALPSFERWSRVCRDPIVWLNLPDPIETQDAEADDDSDGLSDAFSAILDRFGAAEWSAGELEAAADERMGSERTARATKLADGLAGGGLTDPRRVRYWLREMRDRVAGGLKLVQIGRHARAGRWKIREV